MNNTRIDAVITWVDGEDESFKRKIQEYGDSKVFAQKDVAGSTRYSNLGEIFYCVASLNRFAPFINKIFIITDGQNPNLEPFLEENFPGGHIPVEIVDHKTIFKGYEQYLPVFNSLSIETMMWRIPGLSEHFIYLNDDFFLAAPLTEGDFFTEDGNPVCYASRRPVTSSFLISRLSHRWGKHSRITYRFLQFNSFEIVPVCPYIIKINHTPKALLRSCFENYYTQHPEDIVRNINCRFRERSQYCVEEVQYLLLESNKRLTIKPYKDVLMLLSPYMYGKEGKTYSIPSGAKFICANSIDAAPLDEQKLIFDMLDARIM